jgi:hypothetical protein
MSRQNGKRAAGERREARLLGCFIVLQAVTASIANSGQPSSTGTLLSTVCPLLQLSGQLLPAILQKFNNVL